MTKDDAIKLALRSIRELVIDESDDAPALQGVRMRKLAAEKALREALAEQPAKQEPVAWMDGYRNIYSLEEKAAGCAEATIALVPMANQEKTSGSPINELQCVCGAVWLGEEMVHLPDKRPPASKPWVGLTDEDIKEAEWLLSAIKEHEAYTLQEQLLVEGVDVFARAIEAKLREKNQ